MNRSVQQIARSIEETQKVLTTTGLANDILTRVVIAKLDQFQNKISIGMQDSVTDLLDQFRKEIEQEILGITQTWMISSNGENFLFPINCRYVYSKGQTTVVVIEQPPGRRTVSLHRDLLNQPNSEKIRRVNLLFPYVLFVFKWQNKKLIDAYTGWRSSPIGRLNDPVFNPILPNIHKNYQICWGNVVFANKEINIGCEEAITAFWSSLFNNDLSDFWWEKQQFDPISTLSLWEENSDNPFLFNEFQLASISSQPRTLQDLLDFCTQNEHALDENELRKLISHKIDYTLNKMFKGIMRYFKNSKFDKFYPKDIQNSLKDGIQPLLDEILDFLIIFENEIKLIQKNQKIDYTVEAKGVFWKNGE